MNKDLLFDQLADADWASLADGVMNGSGNEVVIWDAMRREKEAIEAQMARIKDAVATKVGQYGKEGVLVDGTRYTTRQGRRMYAFPTGCSTYDTAKERLDFLQEKMKAAAGTEGFVDKETGELIPPAIITYAADSIVGTPEKQPA